MLALYVLLLFYVAAAKPPNMVVLFVDDLGYGDLGFTGHPSTHTPNLNKLAALGKRLTGWYSGYPVCSASRTALLTGRQPPRVGMVGVINSLSVAGLPLDETTVADVMRQRGYKTLAVGKWHQGQQPQYLPQARGFDRFLGLPFSVDDGTGYVSTCPGGPSAPGVGSSLGPSLPLPLIKQDENGSLIVEQPTDLVPFSSRLLDYTKLFVDDFKGVSPLFMYIAFGHVHTATPNVNPPLRQYSGCAFQQSCPRGPFGDALAEVDWFAGQLVSHLENAGIDKDTLILFTSDNGPDMRYGVAAGSRGIFIGGAATYANGTAYTITGKGSTWEGGIRMPAFAYWPGRISPFTSSDEVVSTMDILPTAARLAGTPVPAGALLDGKDSLFDILLSDGPSAHHFLPFYNGYFSKAGNAMHAARYGQYKVHWVTSPGLGHEHEDIWNSWTWTHDPPLVFDIQADPQELFPLTSEALPPHFFEELSRVKKDYESTFTFRSIDERFGFQWAICCGIGCVEPCSCACTNVTLPELTMT